jgi:hypothetical protein
MAETNVVQFKKKKFSAEDKLVPFLEAFFYRKEKPVRVEKIIELTGYSRELIEKSLSQLEKQLENKSRGLMLVKTDGKVELVIKAEYQNFIGELEGADKDREFQLIDEFLYTKESEGCSSNTIDGYRGKLENFIKEIQKPIEEVTVRDVRHYLMKQRKAGNENSTIRNKCVTLSSYFQWLEKEDLVEKKYYE